MTEKYPLTIALASGKGGVGKTTLAVALARELSRNNRTILFDFDFFNRGLTGLMRHGRELQSLQGPQFIAEGERKSEREPWLLLEVGPNLLQVKNPELSAEELKHVENCDRRILARDIKAFVLQTASESSCDAVVFDCHGGPDNLSFAACSVANYTLIVSEPDKVSFFGTLHFLRQVNESSGEDAHTDLRLVFNKTPSAFSVSYLTRFYDREIRRLFSGKPLLAVFPLEPYLASELENTPFLTSAYPFSLLAKKMRVLVFDLLSDQFPTLVPAVSRRTWAPMRSYTRLSLGKPLALMKPNFVMVVIALLYMCTIGVNGFQSGLLFPKYEAMAAAVDQIEIVASLDQQPGMVPSNCRNESDLKSVLACAKLLDPERYNSSKELAQKMHLPYPPLTLEYRGLEADGMATIEKSENSYFERAANLAKSPNIQQNRDVLVSSALKILRSPPSRLRSMILAVDYVRTLLQIASWAAVAGFFVVLLLSWSEELDRAFTCAARTGSQLYAALCAFSALALWAGAIYVFQFFWNDLFWKWQYSHYAFLVWGFIVPLVVAAVDQTRKLGFDLKYDRQYFSAGARAFFLVSLIAAAIIFTNIVS